MKAEEASAIMSLASSIAKLQIQTGEMLEVLKDILHAIEGSGLDISDDDTEDGAEDEQVKNDNPAMNPAATNAAMEQMMLSALAQNPALAAAIAAAMKQSAP